MGSSQKVTNTFILSLRTSGPWPCSLPFPHYLLLWPQIWILAYLLHRFFYPTVPPVCGMPQTTVTLQNTSQWSFPQHWHRLPIKGRGFWFGHSVERICLNALELLVSWHGAWYPRDFWSLCTTHSLSPVQFLSLVTPPLCHNPPAVSHNPTRPKIQRPDDLQPLSSLNLPPPRFLSHSHLQSHLTLLEHSKHDSTSGLLLVVSSEALP